MWNQMSHKEWPFETFNTINHFKFFPWTSITDRKLFEKKNDIIVRMKWLLKIYNKCLLGYLYTRFQALFFLFFFLFVEVLSGAKNVIVLQLCISPSYFFLFLFLGILFHVNRRYPRKKKFQEWTFTINILPAFL